MRIAEFDKSSLRLHVTLNSVKGLLLEILKRVQNDRSKASIPEFM